MAAGLGFVTSFVFIFLVGVFGSSWIGSSVLLVGEWFIKRMPLVKHIYSASKQISAAISPGTGSFCCMKWKMHIIFEPYEHRVISDTHLLVVWSALYPWLHNRHCIFYLTCQAGAFLSFITQFAACGIFLGEQTELLDSCDSGVMKFYIRERSVVGLEFHTACIVGKSWDPKVENVTDHPEIEDVLEMSRYTEDQIGVVPLTDVKCPPYMFCMIYSMYMRCWCGFERQARHIIPSVNVVWTSMMGM